MRRQIEDAFEALMQVELPISAHVCWIVFNVATLVAHFRHPAASLGDWVIAVFCINIFASVFTILSRIFPHDKD